MKPLLTFDLDNTLLNSDKAHVLAYQYALKKLNFKVLKGKEIYIQFGKPKYEVAKAISGSNNLKIIKEITRLHDQYLWTKSYKLSKIIPNVKETLNYLKKKYEIPVYVCTNSWKFDPKTIFGFPEIIEKRPKNEVWNNPPKGVNIINPAFEKIDPDLITAIISELGILRPDNFISEVQKRYPWMIK